ncbi:MAG: hypothetical protein LBV61_05990 [Burkholderiaceae bacterium]|jgi:hypothetical protein|nr:hypothetical protein [Burkholderiaceae bacterium]
MLMRIILILCAFFLCISLLCNFLLIKANGPARHFGYYDILCAGSFEPVRLKDNFKSSEGIILPKGIVVYLRSCQYGNQVYLPALMEPVFFHSLEPIDSSVKEDAPYSLVPEVP